MSKDLLNTVNDNLKCDVFYLPYFTKRVILHIYIVKNDSRTIFNIILSKYKYTIRITMREICENI